jgi:hypothetical protein
MSSSVHIPHAFGRNRARASTLALTVAAALATVALLLAGAGPAAPSATAAPTSAAALPGCNMDLHARPGVRRTGNNIVGFGGFYGCSTQAYANLELQRHRWWGWQTLKSWSGTMNPGQTYTLPGYNCSGNGTYTYRTIMTGRNNGGSPTFKESGHLRTTC